MVAVVLFTVGALFSVYEGIHRITHPEKVTVPVVAFAVLGVAIVLEGLSLRTAVASRTASELRSRGLRRFIQQAKAPELPTVLLEDMAALTGLVVRADRRDPGHHHRQRPVGRCRVAGHRRAARAASR